MEEKTTKQHVSHSRPGRTAVDGTKWPWTKPEIRIMKVAFTASGNRQRKGESLAPAYSPS